MDTASMEVGGVEEGLGAVGMGGRGYGGGRGAKAKEFVKAPTLAEELICCHFGHFFFHRQR